MNDFLLGMLCALHLIAAGFFVRYWRATGDRLFVMFAGGFGMFAVNQLAFALLGEHEVGSALYLIRFLGFMMIIIGILDKNRR